MEQNARLEIICGVCLCGRVEFPALPCPLPFRASRYTEVFEVVNIVASPRRACARGVMAEGNASSAQTRIPDFFSVVSRRHPATCSRDIDLETNVCFVSRVAFPRPTLARVRNRTPSKNAPSSNFFPLDASSVRFTTPRRVPRYPLPLPPSNKWRVPGCATLW